MGIDHYIGTLARLCGIEYQAEIDVKVALLKTMGILDRDFDKHTPDENRQRQNLELLRQLVEDKEAEEFIDISRYVPVLRQNQVEEIVVSLPEGVRKLRWNFYEDEDPSKYYKGEANIVADEHEEPEERLYRGEISVDEMKPYVGERETKEINGVKYRKYLFKFPFEVRLGYHEVEFEYDRPDGTVVGQKTHLISAPEKCYDGLGIREGKKTWGVPVQLYEQVSENNLGIGNFSDLAQLGHVLGKHGAGLIGVNPLHASQDNMPENASPYGPDSRMFFNYIYTDVTAVDEFKKNPDIQAYYNSPEFQEKLKKNRRRTYVDYTTTQELVDDILHRCFEKFEQDRDSEEHKRFEVFCTDKDGILEMFATFRALNKWFTQRDVMPVNWREWPEEYKNPNSEAIKRFQAEHKSEIEYYKYTQWLCEKQLQFVKETCHNSGMKIGLYMDMAVGASFKGFEAWYYSDLYLKGTAGAEPDILSQNGQKWGLLGFNPIKLQKDGYEPYRRILEANMKYAGCLRIDHVLQLNRLYIYPEDGGKGSYVYYNSQELMAIVALESHRHKTMVIGEDLGNSQEKFKRDLENFGIMSYKVLPFEHKDDCWGSMVRPEEYMQMSVCATSTHDTPTLVNQWNVRDVWQKKHLGIITEEQANAKFGQYANQRQALNWVLGEYRCWEEVGGKPSDNPKENANIVPEKYVQAVAAYMAQSNSAIMLMPFSDIFGASEMGNIPGTTEMEWSVSKPVLEIRGDKSFPNWRRKMHIPVEHIEEVDKFLEIVGILNKYRSQGNDGRGRYYQFSRPGNDLASTLDFSKAQRIYNIIKHKEEYQFSTLLKNRYSEAYKKHLDKRRIETQSRYDAMVQAWMRYKKANGL